MVEVSVVLSSQLDNKKAYYPIRTGRETHRGGSHSISSGGFGGLYFDQIESGVISLLYHRSGQKFLGSHDGDAYNHFGLLYFDEQHLNAVKSDISNAANTLGIPKGRVVFTLQTSDSDGG